MRMQLVTTPLIIRRSHQAAGVKETAPFHFVQMMPYAATLLILVVALGRKRFPRALGKPYVREFPDPLAVKQGHRLASTC
jgi:ABC-type uncharacterized transport system permease subunit